MPAFQELLTQLSSEYERLESALADALADLRVCRGLQDSVDDEEEEAEEHDEQREVCKHGWTWSCDLTPPPVEKRLSMEPVAEEGPGLMVSPVAAANIRSRGASGRPVLAPILVARAPTEQSAVHKKTNRYHCVRSSSGLSPTPCVARGASEGAMHCLGTTEGVCKQYTWSAYMSLQETYRPCGRYSANERLTRLAQLVSESARISPACSLVLPGASAEGSCKEDVRAARVFQLASSYVINPEHSPALEKWDHITMVALAYVALVTPVQVSMLEAKLDPMFFVNCFIDFIFFCDMVLQFFLMYPLQTNGVHTHESRHPKIIVHYLKTWFAIDILSIVPIDLFAVLSSSEGVNQLKIVKAVRLMRLLKLMRVLKASRVIHRFEARMSITYRRLALLKFFVILYVITHWLANLWALTLVIVDESEGIPRWVDALTELEANVEVKTKDSPAKLYIACLYFTSYTITSVGYGDIGPQNISERVVLTFIVMASGISWAVVLGQVCGIVVSLGKDEQAFRATMDELNLMMKERLLPQPMRTRLRSFFLSNKAAHRKALNLKIVSAMSPGLRAEVSWEINRVWLNKVNFIRPFLEEEPELMRSFRPFVFDMSLMMEQVVFAQGETFGVPHTMYILNRGLVVRLNRWVRSGSVWGTDFVLSDLRLLEAVDAFALTYVELTTLTRHHFFDLVQRHSTCFPDIYQRVRRYCCWLAFQRALLLEARRRRGVWRGHMKDTIVPMPRVSGVRPFPEPPAPPPTP